jgi:hypothetical protein
MNKLKTEVTLNQAKTITAKLTLTNAKLSS